MSKIRNSKLKTPFVDLIESFNNNTFIFAFANNHKIIASFNKEFKKTLNEKRITGKTISSLFSVDDKLLDNLNEKNSPLIVDNKKGTGKFLISAVNHNKKRIGYSITNAGNTKASSSVSEKKKEEPFFQKEWEYILSLLIKDASIEELTKDFLQRSIAVTNSSWGIVIPNDKTTKQHIDLKLVDEDNLIVNQKELLIEIKSNLSYILEWFKINKKTLNVTPNKNSEMAGNIFKDEEVSNFIMVPCSIENKVSAVLVLAKARGFFTSFEVNLLEQISTVFAFAINFTIAEILNTTLENKLLQSQKLETIGKLAGGIAHDLNNLLSSIFGSLNLLKKKLNNRQDVAYLLENIESCSIRAADLSKGLLNYGKPTPKRKTIINPGDTLNELLKVILQTFPGNIKIIKHIENTLNDIMGNSTEIYQVLLNLCINAKEAIKENGSITIEAKNFIIDKKNSFNYPLLPKGGYVWFSVSDTGMGITEENLSKIFDPYFSTKKKDTGSGLGLYVTYGIIKAHNGYIDVTSKLNEGTCFDIFIPSFEKPKEIEKVKTEKIILLADDEIMLRDLLAELLESYDYQVICVQDGREVLTVLTEEIKVDLLIIDYNMPEMDGITCINKIKELGVQVPIILSTGSVSATEDLESEKMHVDYILTKPYEFDQMLQIVQKLI